MHIIHDFAIAKRVPTQGTARITKLAAICGIPEVQLRRILQHAMTNRIFTEPVPGAIAHTPISYRLAYDPLMRAAVSMLVDEIIPAAACLSHAKRKYGASTAATNTAWALANHTSAYA